MSTGTIYSGFILCPVLGRDDGQQERQPRPVQQSQRLCDKNHKYYSSKAREVKLRLSGDCGGARGSGFLKADLSLLISRR